MKYINILFAFIFLFSNQVFALGENKSSDIIASDISDEERSYRETVVNRISDSFELLMKSDYGNPMIDCYVYQITQDLENIDFLWKDIGAVNAELVDSVFSNFDQFLTFTNYFHPQSNDPDLVSSGFYFLHTLSQMMVDNEKGLTQIDRETMLMLIEIAKNEPFQQEIPEGVSLMVEQLDYIEIKKSPDPKDEDNNLIQISIHGKDEKDILVGMEKFMQNGDNDTPVDQLFIEDKAVMTFYPYDHSKRRKSVGKKILKLLKRAETIDDKSKAELADKFMNGAMKSMYKLNQKHKNPDSVVNYNIERTFEDNPEKAKQYLSQFKDILDVIDNPEERKKFSVLISGKLANAEGSDQKLKDYAQEHVPEHQREVSLVSIEQFSQGYREEVTKVKSEVIKTFDENDRDVALQFVKEAEYPQEAPPVYFEARGIKVTLKGALGAFSDGQLKSGVMLPGLRNEGRDKIQSFFVKGSGTGIGSLYSLTFGI